MSAPRGFDSNGGKPSEPAVDGGADDASSEVDPGAEGIDRRAAFSRMYSGAVRGLFVVGAAAIAAAKGGCYDDYYDDYYSNYYSAYYSDYLNSYGDYA